jgi:hypothetical protein
MIWVPHFEDGRENAHEAADQGALPKIVASNRLGA